MLNILCYAPYSNFNPIHGYWETTLLHGLQLRNCHITYVLCDIDSQVCDIFKNNINNCNICKIRSKNLAISTHMQYTWISSYLQPKDIRKAFQWLKNIDIDTYPQATFGDYKLGEYVLSSFFTYHRTTEYHSSNLEHVKTYKNLLFSGIKQLYALENIFKNLSIDRLLHFNGRFFISRIASEVAEKHNIPCYTHERGLIKDTILVSMPNKNPLVHPSLCIEPDPWMEIPLIKEEITKTENVIYGREYGEVNDACFQAYNSDESDEHIIYKKLNISPSKKIWTFFTSSEDELKAYTAYSSSFPQHEAIMAAIQTVQKIPDVHLLIRVHPNTSKRFQGLADVFSCRFFEAIKAKNYSNVTVIDGDNPINTYTLMYISALGMVTLSTCGIEMACRAKPVICAHRAHYAMTGAVYFEDNPTKFINRLETLYTNPPSQQELNRLVIRAMRYYYFYNFRMCHPFPLVPQDSPTSAHLSYTTLEPLLPGKDTSLDFICDSIKKGKVPIYLPTTQDLHRTTQDEKVWLRQIIKK